MTAGAAVCVKSFAQHGFDCVLRAHYFFPAMRNVLVTGGAGFIGANFVRCLLDLEPAARVINLDLLTYAGSRENLTDLPDPSRHTLVHGDICDRDLIDRLLTEHEIDTIVHFAAESHVDRSITGPAAFVQTNIVGTFALLDAARRAWKGASDEARRFHHVSTDEVFGALKPHEPPFHERTAYSPNSPYAASKASSDHLVRAYHHTYGLPVTISNCSNNYGPLQFPEKLIPLMILNGLSGMPLPVYGDGRQVRDWLHVEDHCRGVHAVLKRGRPGGTYLFGGGNQLTNLEVVRLLCDILDEVHPEGRPHANLIRFVADRPGHDLRYAIDDSQTRACLHWSPTRNLQDGLRETVAWYRNHSAWVDAIRRQGEYQDWLRTNYAQRGAVERVEAAV